MIKNTCQIYQEILKASKNSCAHSWGYIKSTDHRPLTQRPTDQTITNPPTQKSSTQPTRFYFKDLINEEYLFYRTQTQLGRCETIFRSITYLMNKYLYKIFIYLHKIFIFSFLQKKTTFL